MVFERPLMLILLMVPAAALVWAVPQRMLRLTLPFDHGNLPALRPIRWLLAFLDRVPGLMLVVVVLVIAKPQRAVSGQSRRLMKNIEFVLDCSGSMEASLGSERRFDAAMRAIANFTERRRGDSFGLTVFASEALNWIPLTDDPDAIHRSTPFVEPGSLKSIDQGTEIKKALRVAREVLVERAEGSRMLILVTDGKSPDLRRGGGAEVGRELAAASIPTYVIHVASQSVPIEMVEIAEVTGATTFAVDDELALADVFRKIDEMESPEFETLDPHYENHYRPLALAGLVLSALYIASLLGLRYTPW